jgi:hypothetical protein
MGFIVVNSKKPSAPSWGDEAWININDIDLMREVNTPDGVCLMIYQTGTKHEIFGVTAERIARAIQEVRVSGLPFLRV